MKRSDLRQIPGVGAKTEQALIALGYPDTTSLKDADPEEIYRRDCLRRGVQIDRCQLYVYRLCVYYASSETHDPEKLRWWNWKEEPPKK